MNYLESELWKQMTRNEPVAILLKLTRNNFNPNFEWKSCHLLKWNLISLSLKNDNLSAWEDVSEKNNKFRPKSTLQSHNIPSSFDVYVKVIYPKYSKHWPYTVAHTIGKV